jgi:hypothetical protein
MVKNRGTNLNETSESTIEKISEIAVEKGHNLIANNLKKKTLKKNEEISYDEKIEQSIEGAKIKRKMTEKETEKGKVFEVVSTIKTGNKMFSGIGESSKISEAKKISAKDLYEKLVEKKVIQLGEDEIDIYEEL